VEFDSLHVDPTPASPFAMMELERQQATEVLKAKA
jgi:hypothetical protein